MTDNRNWFLINGQPDPALAAEIDDDLRQKIKQNPTLTGDLTRLNAQKADTAITDDLAGRLVFLRDNYNLDQEKVIFSDRPVIGPLFIKFKKFFYYLVHDVMGLTLQNQATYNFFVSKTLKDLADRINQQQDMITKLEEHISKL